MINKFLLVGGGLTLAGAGTWAGVGIYYANQNKGTSTDKKLEAANTDQSSQKVVSPSVSGSPSSAASFESPPAT